MLRPNILAAITVVGGIACLLVGFRADAAGATAGRRDVTPYSSPKTILAYTEYAASWEYSNVLAGIDSVGMDYVVTELDDYTQLDSELSGHEVLLIPEQQYSDNSQLESIGAAWGATLGSFVNDGGVVIQCDARGLYGILTGAGLMDISSSSYYSYLTVTLTEPNDPVAQDVSDFYSAREHSCSYVTPETDVVARGTTGALVINKECGLGNVVLIGHDYYSSNSDQDLIIGNAVFNLPGAKDDLVVTPSVAFACLGDEGGPFAPASTTYKLTNTGLTACEWTAGAGESWLDLSATGGTLDPGEHVTVEVSLNSNANLLAPDIYTDEITFANVTSGAGKTREVTLRVDPKKILVYTQYSWSRDYANTFVAIDSVGRNYVLTEFDDFTQLDSRLAGQDVLLIPQQQYSNNSQLESIGAIWGATLASFVNNGGAVVQCDGSGLYGILTGAGLMEVNSSSTYINMVVTLTQPDDLIAQGVSSSYSARSYSCTYETPESGVVAEGTTGAVVINKEVGLGNVVLIGHDYYFSNADQDLFLGNAVFNLDSLIVSPFEGFLSCGSQGGLFFPSSKVYALMNAGDAPVHWTAGVAGAWTDVSPSNGTLDPGDTEGQITVSLNSNASALSPGEYVDVLVIRNTTTGAVKTRNITLNVLPQGVLLHDDFSTVALNTANWANTYGSPTIDGVGLSEPSPPYSLRLNSASGIGDLVQSRVLDLSGTSYSQVRLEYWFERTGGGENPEAGDDLVFSYWDGLSWAELCRHDGDGNDMTEYEEAVVLLPDEALHAIFMLRVATTGRHGDDWFVDDISITRHNLKITPLQDFASWGYEGRVFSPSSKIYALVNTAESQLSWTAEASVPWLDVIPSGGTISPGDPSTPVDISINPVASTMAPGVYSGAVTFTDSSTGFLQTRNVTLEILMVPGDIEVTDSIAPIDDANLPYGEAIIGLPRTEHITVTNTDSNNPLVVTDFRFQTVENFEDGDLSEYTILGGTHIVSNAAAHDGHFGLQSEGWGLSWIYRDDDAAMVSQGDTISYWVNPRVAGRAYCGFGASAAGAYSIVVASNTGQLLLQLNRSFGYTTIGSAAQEWTYDKWYRLEVEWGVGGNITGWLFDSDGTTLLNTVTAVDSTYVYGGIAFRAFGNYDGGTFDYFDTVERFGAASASAREMMAGCLPGPGDVVLPDSAEAVGWDEENQASIFDESKLSRPLHGCEQSRAMVPTASEGSPGGFSLENEPNFPVTIPPLSEFTFDVVFDPANPGRHESEVVIESNDEDEPAVEVVLSGTAKVDYLEIVPKQERTFSGHPGGPFVPSQLYYQLTNNHTAESIDWLLGTSASWLDISQETGTLAPGESTTIVVYPNVAAQALPEGDYAAVLEFTDVFTTLVQIRSVEMKVLATPKIWATPDSMSFAVQQGRTATQTLTIGNTGIAELEYRLTAEMIDTQTAATMKDAASDVARPDAKAAAAVQARDFRVPAPVPFAQGKLLVRFAPRADDTYPNKAQRMQILSSTADQASIVKEYGIVPGLCLIELPAGMTVEEALVIFNERDDILYAQPDYVVFAESTFPDDTYFDDLWGMHNTGQSDGKEDADIDAPEAWDTSIGDDQIIVAVIDTGVDYTHPDLASNMWVNKAEYNGISGLDDDGNGYIDDIYGYDFVNDDGDPMDDHYHGTHCAGTIGAVGNNGTGVVGICWDVSIMAVKFLDSGGGGLTSDAVDSIEYCILMGVNVMSNSWGGEGYYQALKDAIDAAGDAGILFVAAAGNLGTDNDVSPHYPSNYTSDNIIAVMSTDKYDNRSGFSSYGANSVDIAAPGSDIFSCTPAGGYQFLDGTSMAAPHVSGACALLWSVNPFLPYTDIRDVLYETVDSVPSLNGLCVSNGRLNLHNAVRTLPRAWLKFAPDRGTIVQNDSNDISIIAEPGSLAPGTYPMEVVVSSNDIYTPELKIPLTLTVEPDDLNVKPVDGMTFHGTAGGPVFPAQQSFSLDNAGAASIQWNLACSEEWLTVVPQSGILGAGESAAVQVTLTEEAYALSAGAHSANVTFTNSTTGVSIMREVTLQLIARDFFTELFDEENFDLSNQSLIFIPNGSSSSYQLCLESVTEFPTDPDGGTPISLADDDYVESYLDGGAEVLLYGQAYTSLFVGSNGYITFLTGDTGYSEGLDEHFEFARISALFDDLSPNAGGQVSWKQLSDRVAVTFENVPEYQESNSNSFQIELFFDGTIRVTYLQVEASDGLAGLSAGEGTPDGFVESDLSEYSPCHLPGDFEPDGDVDLADLRFFVSLYLESDCNALAADESDWCFGADLNQSGEVNLRDFAILAGYFGAGYWLDTDRDGMPNGWENEHGLDPYSDDSQLDADHDGLTNIREYYNYCDPYNPDTDGDGMHDGWEADHSLNPLMNDADGDADNDGYTNLFEYFARSLPDDASSLPWYACDLHEDGIINFRDLSILAYYWGDYICSEPDWCEGTDFNMSGRVDSIDLRVLSLNWLWGDLFSDFNYDGTVNFNDFAILAYYWDNYVCSAPDWCEGCDYNQNGYIDSIDVSIFVEAWLWQQPQ
jgi:subtilisin family serine protease